MVSQYFGAKAREDLSNTIGTSIVLALIGGIFVYRLTSKASSVENDKKRNRRRKYRK